jgi:hypothetical protein
MSTRKKNAVLPRQGKQKPGCNPTVPCPPSELGLDIGTLRMVGGEQVVIDHEEDDNIGFMAELIDPI